MGVGQAFQPAPHEQIREIYRLKEYICRGLF